MLEEAFSNIYAKFRLHFFKKVFGGFQKREASLTTVETFCMEVIHALNSPTINEFSSFLDISSPNAAYKVSSLVQKGYILREQSPDDRREYRLVVTQKYIDYCNVSDAYLSEVIGRVYERFSPEEIGQLEHMLRIISTELMAEVPLPGDLLFLERKNK